MAQSWKQEGDEAEKPLCGETDDSRQTDPAVQGIQIVDGRIGQIVRVKSGLQTNRGQQQSRHHQRGMKPFQFLLWLIAQQTVDKNTYKCTKVVSYYQYLNLKNLKSISIFQDPFLVECCCRQMALTTDINTSLITSFRVPRRDIVICH